MNQEFKLLPILLFCLLFSFSSGHPDRYEQNRMKEQKAKSNHTWTPDFSHAYDENRRLTHDKWHKLKNKLRDDYENADFIIRDVPDAHREKAQYHWKILKNAVTPEKLKAYIKPEYFTNKPFPHTYIDDLFPLETLEEILREVPDNPANKDGCVKNGQRCFKSKVEKFKNAIDDDVFHGPATSAFFAFLRSISFVGFLEELTGIKDILPDPHYLGAGIHQTLSGGFLDIHADFNRYPRYALHRRVNILFYLNPQWNDSWGGELELWSRDLKSCDVKLSPVLNRLVVFSSTDFSYHGHQVPLRCPKDRSRRSIAMYYYTQDRPSEECLNRDCFDQHTTLFQKTVCPTCTSDCEKKEKVEFNRKWKQNSWFSWW